MSLQDHPSNKEKQFYELHHNGQLLVLPNIWDPLGALLLQDLGYKAVATASASIALANGYPDGEKIPFDDLLSILKRIVNSVNIPVTADIESGYAKDNRALSENIKKLIDTGISGINFEDSKHDEQTLLTKEVQAEKINLIRNTASRMGSSLFINARIDVFIRAQHLSAEEKMTDAIARGNAYKSAGADCLYPIFLKDKDVMIAMMQEIGLPVNILMVPGIPDFAVLKEIGLARISLGPGFLKKAIQGMKQVAQKLLVHEGMEDITTNPVTGDYLNNLIFKKYDDKKN